MLASCVVIWSTRSSSKLTGSICNCGIEIPISCWLWAGINLSKQSSQVLSTCQHPPPPIPKSELAMENTSFRKGPGPFKGSPNCNTNLDNLPFDYRQLTIGITMGAHILTDSAKGKALSKCTHQGMGISRAVLATHCYYNKLLQTWWSETIDIYYLTVLGVTSLK